MPGFGAAILRLALVVFAYTTVLGWSFYGEKCWEFLLGTRALLLFRLAWVALIPFGAIAQLDFARLVADTFNGLMAIPTLIALLLNPVALRLNRDYFAEQRGGGTEAYCLPTSCARPVAYRQRPSASRSAMIPFSSECLGRSTGDATINVKDP